MTVLSFKGDREIQAATLNLRMCRRRGELLDEHGKGMC